MKVSIGFNLQAGAFGGGNQFGRVLAKYLQGQGVEVSFDLQDPALDLILLCEPDRHLQISAYDHHAVLHYLREINPRAVVVHRLNNTSEARDDADKTFNKFRLHANQIADFTVFVSQWVQRQYEAVGYHSPHHTVILNGGDQQLWHPKPLLPHAAGTPFKLVTHHWSTHPNKGHDVYLCLDRLLDDPTWRERVSFTFIGRLPEGIHFKNTRYVPSLAGQALADELRQHDIYLTASRHEAGPNHCLEGALCGLPLLYIESGAMPEYGQGYGVGFTPENFEAQLAVMLETYPQWASQVQAYPFTDKRMCQSYFALFQDLLEERETILARRPWLKAIPTIQGQTESAITWLRQLPAALTPFLESLTPQAGRFLPAQEGLTAEGQSINLPFSCLALKTYLMLGLWDKLPLVQQKAWLEVIQGFQLHGNPLGIHWGDYACIDPALVQPITWQTRRLQRWKEQWLTPHTFTKMQRMVSAETKQAIATLSEVGAQLKLPYRGFPTTPHALKQYLSRLDWSQPWASGAHLATVAVFYQVEAPRFMPPSEVQSLLEVCRNFAATLLDPSTGAYFQGNIPPYDELINGAMKILTALDWLATPIHAPEKLIDTTLQQQPRAEGCHLVDAVYVLYRCAQQTDYRQADLQAYVVRLVDQLVAHFNPLDGGFSYHVGRSQTHFYGVQITWGYPISDLHGTTLLTWAAGMILHLLEAGDGWRIIKP